MAVVNNVEAHDFHIRSQRHAKLFLEHYQTCSTPIRASCTRYEACIWAFNQWRSGRRHQEGVEGDSTLLIGHR